MQRIKFRATFQALEPDGLRVRSVSSEVYTVSARTINAGFRRALVLALEPLGNGSRRELSRLEFEEVV